VKNLPLLKEMLQLNGRTLFFMTRAKNDAHGKEIYSKKLLFLEKSLKFLRVMKKSLNLG